MFNKKIFIFSTLVVLSFLSCATRPKTKKEISLPPRKLGVVTAAIVKRNSKELLPRDYSFVLITKTETLRIHHKLMGDNVWIFFSPEQRKALINAINLYLESYKGKLKDEKNKAYFGKEKIQMVWGLLNVAHKAFPTVRFEYEYLKNGKPYFIIANKTIESEKNDANSPAIKIALSPAQCRKIIALISDEAISEVMESLKTDFEQYDDEDFEENVTEEKETEDEEMEDFE